MQRNETVLVVGGAGYIGSHTVLALRDAGFRTVVYDNFSNGHRDACFGDAVVEGDLADVGLLTRTLQGHDIGSVIHFAALIEAGVSVREPLPFYRNNVAGTIGLIEAMRQAGTRRIVFSSTAAVYGNAGGRELLDETLPIAPINPYGHSKAMAEAILASEAHANGLKAIALRYFNAAGADPEGRTGERHDPESHLIPLVIQAAMGLRDGISIFGTDYPTPDGTCIRDYIHVSDLADAHVAALRTLLGDDLAGFRAMNLGTGTGHSVREVIEAVREVSGCSFDAHERPRRPGDPAFLVADPSLAEASIGWRAARGDLRDIVRDAWAFAHRGD